METFGLLDFLKPLLALSQNTPTTPPSKNDSYITQSPAQKPEREQENTQIGESEPASPDTLSHDDFPPQNAAVAFLETHDARAKRLRKK